MKEGIKCSTFNINNIVLLPEPKDFHLVSAEKPDT